MAVLPYNRYSCPAESSSPRSNCNKTCLPCLTAGLSVSSVQYNSDGERTCVMTMSGSVTRRLRTSAGIDPKEDTGTKRRLLFTSGPGYRRADPRSIGRPDATFDPKASMAAKTPSHASGVIDGSLCRERLVDNTSPPREISADMPCRSVSLITGSLAAISSEC